MAGSISIPKNHRRIADLDDAYHRLTGGHLMTSVRRPEPRVTVYVWSDGTETTTVTETALRMAEALCAYLVRQRAW
jgi:hypothetical protein